MATFIFRKCPNEECISHKFDSESEEKLYKQEGKSKICSQLVIGASNTQYEFRCEKCGHVWTGVRDLEIKKTRWPRFAPDIGKTFESRDSEKKYAKENGLTAV